MDDKHQSHAFGEQDVDAILKRYGAKVPEDVRERTMDGLAKQREAFVERELARSERLAKKGERRRGRSR